MADELPELPEHRTRVRISMWPGRLTEVDKGEVANLRSQGLLIEDDAQPLPAEAAGDGTAAGKRVTATAKDPTS